MRHTLVQADTPAGDRWHAEDARSGTASLIDALMPRARTTSTTPQQAIELNWPFPWETQR